MADAPTAKSPGTAAPPPSSSSSNSIDEDVIARTTSLWLIGAGLCSVAAIVLSAPFADMTASLTGKLAITLIMAASGPGIRCVFAVRRGQMPVGPTATVLIAHVFCIAMALLTGSLTTPLMRVAVIVLIIALHVEQLALIAQMHVHARTTDDEFVPRGLTLVDGCNWGLTLAAVGAMWLFDPRYVLAALIAAQSLLLVAPLARLAGKLRVQLIARGE